MTELLASLEDVFNISAKKCEKHLDEPYTFRLEITLGYPDNAKYKRLCQKSQIKLHNNLFKYLLIHVAAMRDINILKQTSHIERSDSGKIHLHGFIEISITSNFNIEGLIMDIVNIYYTQLPLRSQEHKAKYHYCHKYRVFLAPPICIQYIESANTERINAWDNYINKNV